MVTDLQSAPSPGPRSIPAIFMVPSFDVTSFRPESDSAEPRPDPACAMNPETSVHHLLLVEDDPRVGSFIAQGLREEGYDVAWAVTADDGLARATTGSFDVMLLDHMLPGRSGIEVAQLLRARGIRTPILMLTARDAPEDRQAAFAAGATDFMGKPFLFDELLDRIRRLIPA